MSSNRAPKSGFAAEAQRKLRNESYIWQRRIRQAKTNITDEEKPIYTTLLTLHGMAGGLQRREHKLAKAE